MHCQIYCEPHMKPSDNEWSKCTPNAQAHADLKTAASAGSARPSLTEVNERIDPRHTRKMLVCSECHGLRFRNIKKITNERGDVMENEFYVLPPSANLHHDGEVTIHLDQKLSLPGHPVERRFARTNAAWKAWAPNTLETAPTTHQKFNYADRAARLMKQELLSGSTAITMAFWEACVSPLSGMAMMMKSPMFRQAVDWCIGVGPGISLLYGCNHCWITPLHPNAWYLMNANWNSETNAIGSASDEGHYWSCLLYTSDAADE